MWTNVNEHPCYEIIIIKKIKSYTVLKVYVIKICDSRSI